MSLYRVSYVTSYSTSDQFQVFLLLLLPHTFSKISRYKSLNYDYPPSSTSLAITISTIAYWWLMHWVFYIWYHIVTTVSERPYYFDITFMDIIVLLQLDTTRQLIVTTVRQWRPCWASPADHYSTSHPPSLDWLTQELWKLPPS